MEAARAVSFLKAQLGCFGVIRIVLLVLFQIVSVFDQSEPNAISIRFACAALLFPSAVMGRTTSGAGIASLMKVSTFGIGGEGIGYLSVALAFDRVMRDWCELEND